MRIFVAIGVALLVAASGLHCQTSSDPGAIQIIRSGSQPSRQASSEHFTGAVRVDPLFSAKEDLAEQTERRRQHIRSQYCPRDLWTRR